MSNRERFVVAYNPGVGGQPVPRADVLASVRDYLTEVGDAGDDEIKVVVSRNVQPDGKFYVFNVALITELSA